MSKEIYIIGRDSLPSLVKLKDGEKLDWTFVFTGLTATEKVCCEIDIDGKDCEVDIAGVYLCPEGSSLDLNILVRHNVSGSLSRQQYRGVVSEGGRMLFDGLVYVAHGAMATKADQQNHSILLSPNAFVQTRPQLEIYADDVECSHGATTGYLNEEELFYMRSRGIPEAEARNLQIISFLSPVLQRLPQDIQNEVLCDLSQKLK